MDIYDELGVKKVINGLATVTVLGGSVGFADPQYRFALGFVKNRMVSALPGDDAAYLIAREVRSALGIPEAG